MASPFVHISTYYHKNDFKLKHKVILTVFLGVRPTPSSSELYPMYVVFLGLAALGFICLGVLVSRKRRREHGQLWFPEGFKVSEPSKKKRREPLGEDSVGLK